MRREKCYRQIGGVLAVSQEPDLHEENTAPSHKSASSPELWCYFLYMVGGVACLMAFFPDSGLAHPINATTQFRFLLGLGGVFILIGVFLHIVLVFRRRASAVNRKNLAKWLGIMMLMAIAYVYSTSVGLDHWFRLAVPLILIGLLIALILTWYLAQRRMPANRMLRLVRAQKYKEAIRIGESFSRSSRDFAMEFNLAAAYHLSGETSKAKALFNELKTRSDIPEPFAPVIDDYLAKLNETESKQA